MLVCNVSLKPLQAGITADLAEVSTATDAVASGNVVFATLIDDPASVAEIVDAYLGEIMVEAASAADIIDAGLIYAAAIDEAAFAADLSSFTVPTVYVVAVTESLTATSVQDAALPIVTTAVVANELTPIFVTPAPASVSVLGSATLLTVQ